MKVLIADAVSEYATEKLEEAGHTVVRDPSLKEAALKETLSAERPQVLVVRSTRIPAAFMDANPSLELIVRAGAGYDTIDVDGAAGRGIFVANCPGKNSIAVAELAVGLIVALDRRIPDNVIAAREGRWNKKEFASARGLKGQTLGVIGLGNIGQAVLDRARSFEMSLAVWSRSLTPDQAAELGIEYKETPLDVASDSDIVTLHIASTPETKNLVDRRFLEHMKNGAFLINTSRSAIIDEEALADLIDEKDLRVAIDVPSGEPGYKQGEFEHPLASHPNVYITHHIGASTQQAADAIAAEAVRVITTYSNTGHVPNAVNLARQTPATHLLTVRHYDRVGVLAEVFNEMKAAGWNVQEMENMVFEGAEAAVAHIKFDGQVREEVVESIASQENVLAVDLIEL